MKKAISNILTGFRWPGRKTTNNSKDPQINAQTSDDEDSRNSEPQHPGKLETEQIMSKIKCDLSETKIHHDNDETEMNFDCDQISRIGKDMSDSSKKLLDEELKMLSSLERLRKNKNELWIMALNNMKRIIPKQQHMKNGTGNPTNFLNIARDIQLIDEMIFFAEEFDNNVPNISETEVMDLEEEKDENDQEKLKNQAENYSKPIELEEAISICTSFDMRKHDFSKTEQQNIYKVGDFNEKSSLGQQMTVHHHKPFSMIVFPESKNICIAFYNFAIIYSSDFKQIHKIQWQLHGRR